MKELFKRIFVEHWQRKLLSIFIAVIAWLIVNHSMIGTKMLDGIPIKIVNVPPGKTIEGLQPNGLLESTISLTLTGKKNIINDLSSKDLQITLDASNKGDRWIASVTKENLHSLNPDIDISPIVQKVSHKEFILELLPLVTAQIPLFFSVDGDAPQGYEVVGIWPNEFSVAISGSEKMIQQLQKRGINLTFDLSKISEHDLKMFKRDGESEVVSFIIPKQWKCFNIPQVSSTPVSIDDPKIELLRIDFVQKELFPLSSFLPIHIVSSFNNPCLCSIEKTNGIEEKNGLFFFSSPLLVRGVSSSFFNLIKGNLELLLFANGEKFSWAIEPRGIEELSKKYAIEEQRRRPQNLLPEDFFIDQFYNYLHSMRFIRSNGEFLQLQIERKGPMISITNKTHTKNE